MLLRFWGIIAAKIAKANWKSVDIWDIWRLQTWEFLISSLLSSKYMNTNLFWHVDILICINVTFTKSDDRRGSVSSLSGWHIEWHGLELISRTALFYCFQSYYKSPFVYLYMSHYIMLCLRCGTAETQKIASALFNGCSTRRKLFPPS